MTEPKKAKEIKIEPNRSDTFFLISFVLATLVTAPLILLGMIFIKIGKLLLLPTAYLGDNLIDYSKERLKQHGKHRPKKNK